MSSSIFLLELFVLIWSNGVLAKSKATTGTFFVKESVKVFEGAIVDSFHESSVAACVLSCTASEKCFKSAMRREKQQCIHLKDVNDGIGSGSQVEVELLQDMTPGTLLCFVTYETFCSDHYFQLD